ncbi:helix-turn-helix transcriptional regulator (plasmid) [Pedobacter sp. BS3]|uniref:AraC family transcriptional regulator n=1 Tax=Pedobacter sp. BS3 TaxID=2567937 RepID=UPI0011EC0438|nr:AraC family transcriptional regulator [Pedobacter sp. BS3]TZF85840.1 helix-turn-helix transcriptional regulator [Pedobacter sp. BS3]
MRPQLIDTPSSGKNTIQIKKVDTFFLESPFHFHHLCELVWIEESYGKRIVGDNIANFEAGDLVLMGPYLPHIWQNDPVFSLKKKSFRAKATVVYFPQDFYVNLSDEVSVIQPIQELIKKAARGLKFYGAAYKSVTRLLSELSRMEGFEKILTFLRVINLLTHSREYEYLATVSYKNLQDERDAKRINVIYQFLMQNFHRNITLEEISAVGNMSPTAFCRFFKSHTQKSFIQFLNELRIGHACKLLQNKDYSIADACYESGYNNLANFNKFFKLITHKNPSEYRKQINV